MAEPQARPRRKLKDYLFLALAGLLLLVFKAALAVAPYRSIERILPKPSDVAAPRWAQRRTTWAILSATPWTFKPTCLPQALAAHTLLTLQGYASVIRVGVRRDEGGVVRAHAWVMCGKDSVIGGEEEDLEKFKTLIDLRGAV